MALAQPRSTSSILKRHGYTEIKKIGEGSFGKALLVEAGNGAKLVCKMIDVSQASRKETENTVKEARLLAAFKHPFIVEYQANFIDGGWLCILMTYCEGGDLTTQVSIAKQAGKRIAEDQVLRWMTQALLALKYIHDKHVLHRDLKSGNFFLSKRGNLKMGDFGIARVLSNTQACAKTQIGTPYYLSPEVCLEKPYTWPSDIWAMGVIFYELCALKLPFDGGQSMVVLVQAITRGTTPQLPDPYSEFSRTLCNEMLSKNPAQRPSADVILRRDRIQEIVKGFVDEAKALEEQTKAGENATSPDVKSSGGYKHGDLVEYYSNTHKTWIPATITGVDAGGNVSIDVKPNTWISKEQQAEQLRPRSVPGEAARSALDKANPACSTQELEDILCEDSAAMSPDRNTGNNDVTVLEEPPTAQLPAKCVGIVGLSGSPDEGVDQLLQELGIDESSVDAKLSVVPEVEPDMPWPEAEVQPGLATSLTAAELDLLNESM